MKKKLLLLLLMGSFYSLIGIVLAGITLNMAMASDVRSQEIKSVKDAIIEIELSNATAEQIFKKIEAITDYEFVYFRNDVSHSAKLDVKKTKTSVADLLLRISEEFDLSFRQENNFISVKKISAKNINEKKLEIIIQTRTVSGKVTSYEDNEGLPGVNVVEKGTSNGTVTDVQGNYSLDVSDGATLVFSSVGYTQEEVEVGNRSVIDLVMTQDIQQLQELVVVGYGTQKRSDLTGSVASVSPRELKQVATVSFDQGLQGRVAGVQVSQSSAAPGGAVSVRIRGVNSINGNNEPLYVIDGIPIIANDGAVSPSGGGVAGQGGGGVASNALASINPGDIESIEVLKDASAAAIYGARGANGVVIITTKQGKAGQTQVSFENYYGVQEVANTYDLLDSRSFATWANEFAIDRDLNPYFTDEEINNLPNTNWQDLIYRSAAIQNHQLTISGGNEKTTFTIGANYFKQDGVVKNSSFQRGSLRLNLNHAVNEKIKVGNSTMISRLGNNRVITDGERSATLLAQIGPPIVPIYNQDGSYTVFDEYGTTLDENLSLAGNTPNAVNRINETSDQEITSRILTNFYLDYELIEGLTFKTTFGANVSNRSRDYYYTKESFEARPIDGFATTSTSERVIYLNENTLSFNRTFNSKHQLNALIGFTSQYEVLQGRRISNSGFGLDDRELNLNEIGSGTQLGGPSVNSFKTDESLLSYIGRFSYSFDNKYLLTITGRADGSSKFSDGNKWGFFPSVGFGWKISNENFLRENNFINNLKLRASYGETGFQEIPPYQSLATYSSQNYSFGDVPVVGYQPSRPENRDLTWQTTVQTNIGIDASFLSNKFSLTADYYIKNTEDLLLFINLPANTGYSGSLAVNAGEVRNQGWELTLGYQTSVGDFNWNTNINLSSNTNEVLSLGDQVRIFGGGLDSNAKDRGNVTEVGQPIGVFFGYKTDGIFASDAEVEEHISIVDGVELVIQPEAKAGDRRFVDTNMDGDISSADLTKIGSPYPDLIYGWSNNFAFKNFDLSLFLQGTAGNDILNVAQARLVQNDAETNIMQTRFNNRWTTDNTNATWPRAGAIDPLSAGAAGFGDYIVEDGSYLRLRDITLGYNLPMNNVNTLRSLRLYISAQNLITITNYSGLNPEVSSRGQSATNFGVDLGGYPISTIYRLGINIGL